MSFDHAQNRVELTFALMLNLARKISYADAMLKQGKWLKNELLGIELRGKSIMVIGDRLRKDMQMPAEIFEMRLLAEDRSLLREADFTVIDDPNTRLDGTFLTDMKDGSYLIVLDVASDIDMMALKEALAKKLGGAALMEGASKVRGESGQLANLLVFDAIGGQPP